MIYATTLQRDSRDIITRIRERLNEDDLKMGVIPDDELLEGLLWVFGGIFFFVAFALAVVPALRGFDSVWYSQEPRPKIGLMAFTVIGLIIVAVGLFYSLKKRYISTPAN